MQDGFLLPEDLRGLVEKAGKFYDRVLAHNPIDPDCGYMFP